jgi:hypothetical protein
MLKIKHHIPLAFPQKIMLSFVKNNYTLLTTTINQIQKELYIAPA